MSAGKIACHWEMLKSAFVAILTFFLCSHWFTDEYYYLYYPALIFIDAQILYIQFKSDVQLAYCIVNVLSIKFASKQKMPWVYCFIVLHNLHGPGDSLITSNCIYLLMLFIMFTSISSTILVHYKHTETVGEIYWLRFVLAALSYSSDSPRSTCADSNHWHLYVSRAWKVLWSFWSALAEIPHSCWERCVYFYHCGL